MAHELTVELWKRRGVVHGEFAVWRRDGFAEAFGRLEAPAVRGTCCLKCPTLPHELIDLRLQLRALPTLPWDPAGSSQPLSELLQADRERCGVCVHGAFAHRYVVRGKRDSAQPGLRHLV